MLVNELAAKLGAAFEGAGDREITSAAPVQSAGSDALSFAGNAKALGLARTSAAGCLIVTSEYVNPGSQTLIRAANPRAMFAIALRWLFPQPPIRAGVHFSAYVAQSADIDPASEVGPHVTIGEHVHIGAGSRICAGCYIGDRVNIGAGSVLHPNVTVYADVNVGINAVLHSGCILGADGFGFVLMAEKYEKFPQVGRVSIGDNVEIGANSCVDRAALGVTTIGDGTKLDNMVHIGHNCTIGKHVLIAAQTGLSGGVVVEDYAVIGGQVGIGDKARIESRAVLGSGSGILTSKIVRGGDVVWGTPARPLREHLQSLAHLRRLPELREELAELKRRLAELESGR